LSRVRKAVMNKQHKVPATKPESIDRVKEVRSDRLVVSGGEAIKC
jgi:hypothetical protein